VQDAQDAQHVQRVIVITKRDRVQGGAKIRRELVDRYLEQVPAPAATPSVPPRP